MWEHAADRRGTWLVAVALAGLAACGEVVGGAGPILDAAVTIDAAPALDGPPADAPPALGPWSEPRLIAELSTTAVEQDATLTGDRLEIVFSSNRTGSAGDDLWTATRATVSQPFGTPVLVANVNTAGAEQHPWISPDGRTLYFSTDGGAGGSVDIYVTTRDSRSSPWTTPVVAVTELNSASVDQFGSLSADGRVAVFVSDRAGPVTGRDIYLASRGGAGQAFNVPSPVQALATAADETGPSLAGGSSALYFARNQDLFIAERAGQDVMALRPIEELNTAEPESDPFATDDQRTIVFTRNNDLYIATR